MKTLLLIAAGLSLIGWAAHTFLGTKEFLSTKVSSSAKILNNWYQSYCAWHLITIDLLMFTLGFCLLAFTDLVETKSDILNFLGVWMIGWAVAWIATLAFSKEGRIQLKKLHQWMIFLILAGCSFWAATL